MMINDGVTANWIYENSDMVIGSVSREDFGPCKASTKSAIYRRNANLLKANRTSLVVKIAEDE